MQPHLATCVTPGERLQGQQQEQLLIRPHSLGCYWGEDCEQVLQWTVHHLIGHWGISPAWEDGHHGQFTWTHWSQRFKSNRQRHLNNVSTVFWWTWTHLGSLLLWLKAMNLRQILQLWFKGWWIHKLQWGKVNRRKVLESKWTLRRFITCIKWLFHGQILAKQQLISSLNINAIDFFIQKACSYSWASIIIF